MGHRASRSRGVRAIKCPCNEEGVGDGVKRKVESWNAIGRTNLCKSSPEKKLANTFDLPQVFETSGAASRKCRVNGVAPSRGIRP